MILLELIISDSDLGNETRNTKLTAILSVAFILVLITIVINYENFFGLILSGDQFPPPIPNF